MLRKYGDNYLLGTGKDSNQICLMNEMTKNKQ